MRIEDVIFSNLLYNEDYTRAVVPHLKTEYFHDLVDSKIYNLIDNYIQTYNRVPSKEALVIDLQNAIGLTEDQFSLAKKKIESISAIAKNDKQWTIDQTEKFCQDRAIHNALRESIKILDNKAESMAKGNIPSLLQDALGVSFDSNIGHSYTDDGEGRYEFYHRVEERIPFDIDMFNKVTKGGLPRKTLTILMGGIGAGKSLCMCHMASANLMAGQNVLYITMELAEERVAERIDANLMNVTIDDLYELPRDVFHKKLNRVKEKTTGKLIIKEYPTSGAGSANFRHLINELRIKKNFVPDVIYLDYMNICASSRFKNNSNVNSYTYVKAIAEEIRGLAVEFNVAVVTATQLNREGLNSSDIDMTNTSESIGAPASADIMWAIIATEELLELGQYMVKQLKNRFSDIEKNKRFVVGVDKSKMRLYNVEETAQKDLVNDSVVFDNTPAGKPDIDFSTFK